MSDNTSTNGSEKVKAPSALDKLHAEWVAAGSKKPDPKVAKTLMTAYEASHKKKLAAEKAFATAMAEEQEAAKAIIRARGKGRFTGPDGTLYTAMSKGESVFLRVDGGSEVDSFG
jgi:hypothetical protein